MPCGACDERQLLSDMAPTAEYNAALQGMFSLMHMIMVGSCCCKIICIGDCSKWEAKIYFTDRLLPGVPEHLRPKLDFEPLYDAFGGKLVHWADYISDFSEENTVLL